MANSSAAQSAAQVRGSGALWRVDFDVAIVARSAIIHRDNAESYGADTFTLFHREKVVTADGELQPVPMISGNSFRGVLRRISENLTAEVLHYEHALHDGGLPTPAAHLMTNGGRLAKAASPLTDEQERHLKNLLPHLALFGGAASARIMSGLLQVDKVLPEVAELGHLLNPDLTAGRTLRPAALVMGAEDFTHLSDTRTRADQAPMVTTDDTVQTRLGVEVLPAGLGLQSQIRVNHATDLQLAYLLAVLDEFADRGHLGGGGASGHGRIRASITATVRRGATTDLAQWERPDWAGELAANRDAALTALTALT